MITDMITEITREEVQQKLEHPKGFVLLEALPPEQYRRAHLPGALNLPPDHVQRLASELVPKKDMAIIVLLRRADVPSSGTGCKTTDRDGLSRSAALYGRQA